MLEELNAVVFEKDELGIWDASELKALLLILAHQETNSDVEIKL